MIDRDPPATCRSCHGPLANRHRATYCQACYKRLRREGAFIGERPLPIPAPSACRCGRPKAAPAAFCTRCESVHWHQANPVPVPWTPPGGAGMCPP